MQRYNILSLKRFDKLITYGQFRYCATTWHQACVAQFTDKPHNIDLSIARYLR